MSVELLDINNKPRETDINVTFVNDITGDPVYNFVHYRDSKGKPDSVEVDAVISYDLVANTLPPVVERNIVLKPGEHNVIALKTPTGFLQINMKNHTEYENGVMALVKTPTFLVNSTNIPHKEKYLVGNYDLEILTLPRVNMKGVEISANETTVINIPSPGLVNINASVKGIGSIYEINEFGQQRWIYNLPAEKTKHTLAMQPGNYQVVFRANSAFGSKYTEIKEFKIASGSTTNLKLFGR